MRVLAIDTATRRGSAALLDGDQVLGACWLDDTHGRALAPAIARVLAGGGVAALDGIALSIGPGSFTGLRIGLAFTKGLALAKPLPVYPVSTLELIAAASGAGGPGATGVLAVIDARNGEVFARLDGVIPEGLTKVDALIARLAAHPPGQLAGEPPAGLLEALPGWTSAPDPELPWAVALARLAAPRLAAGEGRDPVDIQPSYGQPAAVDRPRHGVDTPASQT